MPTKRLAGLAALAMLALPALAAASPDGTVDRDRLRRVAQLPAVGPSDWYYSITTDGRLFAGGEEPERCDVATLRARMRNDDSDAARWLDAASACRRVHDAAQEKECVASAVAILRRLAAAQPDDGGAAASLGLALVASGDDAGAEESFGKAAHAPNAAWAGVAAAADLLVMRAVGRTAERRFAAFDDARDWLVADSAKARLVDAAVLADAAKRYDEAAAGVESSAATGAVAASVYVRRMTLRSVVHAALRKAEAEASADVAARNSADQRKAMDALAPDPYAITLTALEDAMSEPTGTDGTTHVQPFGDLEPDARTKVTGDLARLGRVAATADAPTAARALNGIACVQWFVMRNPPAAEALLRRSVAKDPGLRASWQALVFAMGQDRRWDDLVKVCGEWIKSGETARNRMILAKALALGGHADEAEKEWRAAQALDPAGVETNLGVAVFVLYRAKDDADLKEARGFLDRASAALPKAEGGEYSPLSYAYALADAVALGLAGDAAGAEKAARRILEHLPTAQPPHQILEALGR
jgi:tetratricopeptide (TPR) repeat protein